VYIVDKPISVIISYKSCKCWT